MIFNSLNIKTSEKIFVAGHNGMVGSAIVRGLKNLGYKNLILRSRKQLDLMDQASVHDFMAKEKPAQVYLAAAKVGGIFANNQYPADFIYSNLAVQTNVIHSAYLNGVKKLLFLGSSCIYPRHATQPMQEDVLLSGALEPTNEPYAIAKISGIKMCESYNRQYGVDYRSVMPTNLYGPGDNYHPENSHVVPALIRRFHEAKTSGSKSVAIWGTGRVRREFLYVDDMAEACIFFMNFDVFKYSKFVNSMQSHINIGSGVDMTIEELALEVKNVVGFTGSITLDKSKPDGAPQKLMDSSLSDSMGWNPRIGLQEGLKMAYADFLNCFNG
jgi:GDP-L-fucose synthase